MCLEREVRPLLVHGVGEPEQVGDHEPPVVGEVVPAGTEGVTAARHAMQQHRRGPPRSGDADRQRAGAAAVACPGLPGPHYGRTPMASQPCRDSQQRDGHHGRRCLRVPHHFLLLPEDVADSGAFPEGGITGRLSWFGRAVRPSSAGESTCGRPDLGRGNPAVRFSRDMRRKGYSRRRPLTWSSGSLVVHGCRSAGTGGTGARVISRWSSRPSRTTMLTWRSSSSSG